MNKLILLSLTIFFLTSCHLPEIFRKDSDDNVINQAPPAFEAIKSEPDIVETENNANSVPLPIGEDIIRTFFFLINDKRIPEAIDMMSEKTVSDDATKQAWGVQFNAFNSVIISDIKKFSEESWTDSRQVYKVTLEAEMNSDSANEPIPYFGYDSKTNIRWITIEKNSDNIWKIVGISTGP